MTTRYNEFKTLTTSYGPRIYVDRVVETPALSARLRGPIADDLLEQMDRLSCDGNTSISATYYMWRFSTNEVNYLKAIDLLVSQGWTRGVFWHTPTVP